VEYNKGKVLKQIINYFIKIMDVKKFAGLVVGTAVAVSAVAVLPAYAAVPSVVSMKATGANTITVVYSVPIQTNTWDYTNFTGDFSGRGVVSIGGSGTNTVTLFLSGNALPSGASGYITIGTGVVSVSDNSTFPGGTFQVTSAQAPILSSVSVSIANVSNAFSTTGSEVTLTFNVNESVVNPTVTILGHTIGVSGTGNGPYTLNYTLVSGDAQGTIPATITFTDTSGNTGTATVNITGSGTSSSASSANGYISSNANSPGVLYVGNSITFTLVPSSAEPNARSVSGSYNGVPLSWYTTNGGATYTAVYTIANGQSNSTAPLQISGVTLTDQYGNTVGPFSGYDIQKTITTTNSAPLYIYQQTPVPAITTNPAPSYAFISNAAGTIRYGGSCSSPTTSASIGLNTIVFNALAYGTYSNCTITVLDSAGNASNQLVVSPFTVTQQTTAAPSASTGALTAQIQALQSQLTQLQTQAKTQNTNTATPTSSYKFLKPLDVGSKGTAVTELQKRLTAEGVFSGNITGYYGTATEAAVKKYQTLHGLTPLGNIGPATRAMLNK
jgi:hypothetical protein